MVHNVFVWQKEKTISVRQMAAMPMNISAISPPSAFMNGGTTPAANYSAASFNTTLGANHSMNHILANSTMHQHQQHPQHHFSNGGVLQSHLVPRTTPVTQLTSPSLSTFNHSAYHLPYNHGIRTATATPPTPKVGNGPPTLPARDASGSVSPGMGPTIDLNSVAATNSPHELSTLVWL